MNLGKTILPLVAGLLLTPGSAWSRVLMSQQEALDLVFSSTTVQRKTLFLSEDQVKRIEETAKSKLDSKLVTYYTGPDRQGIPVFAFFSSHIVRTMPETLMAVVNADGTLRLVEILSFNEPDDYLPSKKWLGLFQNRKLDADLWVKRGIRNISGATLTTQAVTDAIRRILATYQAAILQKPRE